MPGRPQVEHIELDSSQKLLFDALKAQGIEGRSVLEIGCGIGRLHHRLLQEGAASVVGIELQTNYLEKARALAQDLGHEDRATYHKGDFMKLAGQLEPADITILDKVVHCYHDPENLIRQSTARTRSLYAVTFLKTNRSLQFWMRLLSPILRLFLPFRVRFSHPELIRAWVREAGFERISHHETDTWYTEVYARRREPTVELREG